METAEIDRATDPGWEWAAKHVHRYLETDGADGHEWNGVPTLILATTGSRTGQPRRTALIYGTDGDDFVVIASKGGSPEHPSWYRNLEADPDAAVQVGAERYRVRARTADADERLRLWERMARIWPAYDEYAEKTDRDIPVVVLQRA